MRNRFNLNESEKNQIRRLHGIGIMEERTYTPSSQITEGNELTDADLNNISQNENDWVKGSWDELDNEIKNIYKKTEEFEGCLEDGDDIVNEQRRENCRDLFGNYNDKGLRRILRKLFGWFPKLRWPRFMRKLTGLEKDVQGFAGTPGRKWRQGRYHKRK